MLERPELFVGTMTEKLLTYALGRGVDAPTTCRRCGAIVREAAAHDYRFSSLVLGIVRSVPFQMRMKPRRELELLADDARRYGMHGTELPVGSSRARSTDVHHQEVACPAGRSCAAWARPSRCRCSTRWCRR